MKTLLDFETLAEFMAHFRDEGTCRAYFAGIRFRDGEYCPHCGHNAINHFANGKRMRCKSCKKDFTIVTGTVFGETKLPLRKWFIAIYLLSTSSKGISSIQLAKHVGVTQKTAWFMDHRLRSAMEDGGSLMSGTVEVDETYVGGKAKNMHASKKAKRITGTGGVDKIAVVGLKSRDGEVRTQVVDNNDGPTLQGIIKENITDGATVMTDDHRGYSGMKGYAHKVVNHSMKEYVNGQTHTNGIESFWALFKRAYHGIYHQMSRKHIKRYLNECAYRVARRGQDMNEIFAGVVKGTTDGRQLPYKKLIA